MDRILTGAEIAELYRRKSNAASELYDALTALVGPDVAYSANEIIIPTRSHTEALMLVRNARKALAKARGEA